MTAPPVQGTTPELAGSEVGEGERVGETAHGQDSPAVADGLGLDDIRENFPAEIREVDVWCIWDKSPRKDGRPSKSPIDPATGKDAKTNEPSTFGPFALACENAPKLPTAGGLGFRLTDGPWIGIDLDHVIDLETGEFNADARELVEWLSPTYAEFSPSGDGLHVLLRGQKPEGWRTQVKDAFGPGTALEVYDGTDRRYFTATGQYWAEGPIADATDDDLELLGELMRPQRKVSAQPAATQTYGDDTDRDLERARFGLLELGLLSADDGYTDVFIRVLAALKGAFGNRGLELAHEWCRRNSHTYDGPEIDGKWPGIAGTDMGCLAGMFDDRDATWREQFKRRTATPSLSGAPAKTLAEAGISSLEDDEDADKEPEEQFTAADWFEIAKQPPVEHLIDGLVPEEGLTVFAAESEAGKSFVVVDWAMRLVHGPFEWLGRKIEPGSVIYLSGEGGSGLGARLRAWQSDRDTSAEAAGGRYCAITSGIPSIDDKKGRKNFAAFVEAIVDQWKGPPALIVVDTLSTALAAGDENDAKVVAPVVRFLGDIQKRYGCAVLVVHHFVKPDRNASATKVSKHAVRGSGALTANVDAVLSITLDTDGVRRLVTLKQRDGEKLGPLRFRLSKVETGRKRRDGRLETSCIVIPAAGEALVDPATAKMAEQARLDEKGRDYEDRIVAQLAKLGAPVPNKSAIVNLTRGNRQSLQSAWDRAVALGRIVNAGTSKTPKWVPSSAEGGVKVPPHTPPGTGEPGCDPGSGSQGGESEPAGTTGNLEPGESDTAE